MKINTQNLRWRHVHVFTEKGLDYVELHLDGKTVPHDAIGRAGVIKYKAHPKAITPEATVAIATTR